ncbi:TetR family transcriptional regulator [Azoarcus sp. TTM-91]|uniref:TetR/AcrR family transcriptional regulator n=1 Tax=Azoarcus sp. TTM-91 TaxID=2691581 RepID=UPI00145E76D0|nr:TetR/AcrR family transcriptional regulator [Azoarcus sp. TTM-91]NMG34032.1 TetR family transcriptional regulator [Azoarcus sp. TTM-91]
MAVKRGAGQAGAEDATPAGQAPQARRPLRRGQRGPSPDKTARRRDGIVRAAMAAFMEHGFADATMADVAQRAGVAKGTPYRYFPTKEALFEGVVQEVIGKALFGAGKETRLAGERVGAYLRRTLLPAMREIELAGRAAVARLVIAEGARFPALVEVYRREAYEPLLRRIEALGREAVAEGELRSDALVRFPHILVGPLWLGMLHNGLFRQAGVLDIGEMFAAELDLIFGPPPESPPTHVG